MIRRAALPLVLVATLALAGCGGGDDSSAAAGPTTSTAPTPSGTTSTGASTAALCSAWDDYVLAATFHQDQPIDGTALAAADLPSGTSDAAEHGRDVLVGLFASTAPQDADGSSLTSTDTDDIGAFGDVVENACLDPSVTAMGTQADATSFCSALKLLTDDLSQQPPSAQRVRDDAAQVVKTGTPLRMGISERHGLELFLTQALKAPLDEDLSNGLTTFLSPIGTRDGQDVSSFNDDKSTCPDLKG